jgi:bacillithiol biosynthesis cysteine-adding enzyme BshC
MTQETIHSSKISGRKRLYLDVLYDPDRAGRFFLWPHPTSEAFTACARFVTANRRVDPREASDLLIKQNRNFDAPEAALAAAAELGHPNAVALFSGQQAGLFGGPLYTIYKSLTLIGWAARVRKMLNCPVVPIFWIAADDHDYEEIRWTSFPGLDNSIHKLVLDHHGLPDRTPASEIPLGASIDAIRAALTQGQVKTEFTPQITEALATDYAASRTISEGFGRWMSRLLGRYGMVVFDPSDPAAKKLCEPLFAEEIEGHDQTAHALSDIDCRLDEAGYHKQVSHPEGHSHLFHVQNGRHALHAENGSLWTDPVGRDKAEDVATWRTRLAEKPEAFSPGVLMRPVVQSYLFPVVGAVCGPSEIAYWAQARALFDRFGQVMPVVLPRSSATITERKITSAVDKLGHPVSAFFGDIEALINEHFERSFPTDLEEQFAAEGENWRARMEELKRTVVAFEPTLAKSFDVSTGRMLSTLEQLQHKVFQAHKRKGEEIRAKFYKLAAHLHPEGHPQERVFNVTYYLNKYGFEFLDRVRDQLKIDTPDHQVIEP